MAEHLLSLAAPYALITSTDIIIQDIQLTQVVILSLLHHNIIELTFRITYTTIAENSTFSQVQPNQYISTTNAVYIKAEVDRMIESLDNRADQLKKEVRKSKAIAVQNKAGINTVRSDMHRLRSQVADLGKDIQRGRSALTATRVEMHLMRQELDDKMEDLRTELRTESESIRTEMREQIGNMRELLMERLPASASTSAKSSASSSDELEEIDQQQPRDWQDIV
jgi:chromosome segregation ATPase